MLNYLSVNSEFTRVHIFIRSNYYDTYTYNCSFVAHFLDGEYTNRAYRANDRTFEFYRGFFSK